MIAFYAYLKRKKRMDKALRQAEGEAGFGGPSRYLRHKGNIERSFFNIHSFLYRRAAMTTDAATDAAEASLPPSGGGGPIYIPMNSYSVALPSPSRTMPPPSYSAVAAAELDPPPGYEAAAAAAAAAAAGGRGGGVEDGAKEEQL